MADNDDFEDENEEVETPKDLRKQLAAHKKAQKALEDELSTLRAKDRDRSVSELLSEKGLPAKVGRLLPASVDIADPTAVQAWLDEYADVFGAPKAEEESEESGEDAVSDEVKAAHQRMADAQAGSMPLGKAQDILAKLNSFTSEQELKDFLATVQ